MVRLLIAGDVCGRLDQLRSRAARLHASAHGPFDALLCCGEFFAAGDNKQLTPYLDGTSTMPLPVYFTCGQRSHACIDKAMAAAATTTTTTATAAASAADEETAAGAAAAAGGAGGGAGAASTAGGDSADAATETTTPTVPASSSSPSSSPPVEIAKNLFFLGWSGVATVSGLQVGYLSGKFDPLAFKEERGSSHSGSYHESDVKHLQTLASAKDFAGVDVLLTAEWAFRFHEYVAKQQLPAMYMPAASVGQQAISELALSLAPRYHFVSSMGVFWKRPPYRNASLRAAHVTRMIALGAVSKKSDKSTKWLHALNLKPLATMEAAELEKQPADTTPCPYQSASRDAAAPPPVKRSRVAYDRSMSTAQPSTGLLPAPPMPAGFTMARPPPPPPPPGGLSAAAMARIDANAARSFGQSGFFFNAPRQGRYGGRGGGRGGGGRRGPPRGGGGGGNRGPPQRTACWFCLASPDIEQHLIVSIGTEAYLALPKGGVDASHVLVVPISHHPSCAAAPDAVTIEMKVYIEALQRCYAKRGLTLVYFERFIPTRGAAHTHLQVFGLPQQMKADVIQQSFQDAGAKFGMTFDKLSPDTKLRSKVGGGHYLEVNIPSAGVRLVHSVPSGARVPLQFGRGVICDLLGCPQRVAWKRCAIPKSGEEALAAEFKATFAAFDPADNDDDDSD